MLLNIAYEADAGKLTDRESTVKLSVGYQL
jgi:hypothetical protein